MIKFTEEENKAIIRSLDYWVSNWDWESPTLFGLEISDFKNLGKEWPCSYEINQKKALLACLGSLRELLYGACALQKEQINVYIGLNHEEASLLLIKIAKESRKFEL